MLRVTRLALCAIDIGQAPMKPALADDVGGNVFMTVETQCRLSVAVTAVVAIGASGFVLLVCGRDLAGHQECLDVRSAGGRADERES